VGLGGYFTSEYVSYPFNMYGTSSYPDLWIDIDKFYKPHGSWLFILLKFGLFGFLIIFYTVIALSYSILKQAMTNFEFTEYSSIIVAIASFLPFLFLVNFSSKLQVFTGVMFAIIATAKTTLKEVP
jgi:O-antigen ligase